MIKGIVQNVVPYLDGWAVYEGQNPNFLRIFPTQEEALSYVKSKMRLHEASVLIHSVFTQEAKHTTLHMMSFETSTQLQT